MIERYIGTKLWVLQKVVGLCRNQNLKTDDTDDIYSPSCQNGIQLAHGASGRFIFSQNLHHAHGLDVQMDVGCNRRERDSGMWTF